MATRGIVAIDCGQGSWRGRYVHWDNYPDRIVPILGELVKRDGIATVAETIINKRHSWSLIEAYIKTDSPTFIPANFEPGYGYFHEDGGDLYTERSTDFSWAQWVYVMSDDGVTVYEVLGGEPETLSYQSTFTWAEAARLAGVLESA